MNSVKKIRIWAQGATDQVGHRTYLAAASAAHEGVHRSRIRSLEFKTMTPSVTTVHALSEYRFSRAVIRGAIQAEREGYDVFFMNHFQDVGLYDARASVNIPVLGLGEATLLHACSDGPQARPACDQSRLHPDPHRANHPLWAATTHRRHSRH